MRLLLLLFLPLATACTRAPSSPGASPIVPRQVAALGETFALHSNILGEDRVINVYLPPEYATSRDRYPVLYLLDGGMKEDFPHVAGSVDVSTKNGVIRPVIVVGIENTVRRRDLVPRSDVPEDQKAAPQAGGNERFRGFLRDELRAHIDRRFRTSGETALIGESLAGLFVVETFLVEPELFESYIAADPSLWWNEQSLVRTAAPNLAWYDGGPKSLYIASSQMQDGLAMLLRALEIYAPKGVRWVHEPMTNEQHGTIFPTAALHGIRMMFAP